MTDTKKHNPLLELLITLVIPALILMKLSGPENLGVVNGLLVALAFPLGWGLLDWLRNKHINLFAGLGLVSVLLTGGIGLLELDNQWLAIKEAAIPAIIGTVVAVSTYTRYPLIRTLLFNNKIMNVERIHQQLAVHGTESAFESRLRIANWLFAGTCVFSAAMNYFLATYIVTSPAGTTAFNEELGQLVLLSYPVIALPSMVMMMVILYYLVSSLKTLAGLSLSDAMHYQG